MTCPSALIVNGRSRRGQTWFVEAKDKLSAAGIDLRHVVMLRKGESLETEIDSAIQKGCEAILVGGGDGSLRIAAQHLAGTNKALGVLPFGTGNAFARDLGIKTDLDGAIEVIKSENVIEVDVAKAGNRAFLNLASVGLSALVASRLKQMPKSLLGPISYVIPFLQALRLIRPFNAKLCFEEEKVELDAFQIVVGNGRYHAGPFLLSESAGLQTGKLVVYALSAKDRTVLYRYALALLLGRQKDLPELHLWETTHFTLQTAPSRSLVIDGELIGRTPVEFQVIPRALRVFSPKNDPIDP